VTVVAVVLLANPGFRAAVLPLPCPNPDAGAAGGDRSLLDRALAAAGGDPGAATRLLQQDGQLGKALGGSDPAEQQGRARALAGSGGGTSSSGAAADPLPGATAPPRGTGQGAGQGGGLQGPGTGGSGGGTGTGQGTGPAAGAGTGGAGGQGQGGSAGTGGSGAAPGRGPSDSGTQGAASGPRAPVGIDAPTSPLPTPQDPQRVAPPTPRSLFARLGGPPTVALAGGLVALLIAGLAAAARATRRRGPAAGGGGAPGAAGPPPGRGPLLTGRGPAATDTDLALLETFVAGLRALDEVGVAAYDPARPTAVIARRVRDPRFTALARDFDRVAYGGGHATPATVTEARQTWAHLVRDLLETRRDGPPDPATAGRQLADA
jgi:hypothetical protein